MLLAVALACGRPDPDPPPATPSLQASCASDPEDPTRATCQVALDAPGHAEVELTDGTETVRFTTDAPGRAHAIPIWGLHADRAWSWVARAGPDSASGAFTPGSLPDALAVEVAATGGSGSTLRGVIGPIDCGGGGFATVLDGRGRVRWYADTHRDDLDMVQFTEASTVLLVADKAAVIELDLLGNVWLNRDDYGLPVHHDVFRRGDAIYTLLADAYPEANGETYVEEIVVKLDLGGNEIWRWDEHDHLDATRARPGGGEFWAWRFPGATDAWHTNALYPTDDEHVLLSLKRESSILRIAEADGSIAWTLAGDGVGRSLGSDFAFAGSGDPTFGDEHHVALVPGGNLTVFDNRKARGLALSLDETAGTASFVADWPLDLVCGIQSSIFPMGDGHWLATCAPGHEIAEFDDNGAEVLRLALACPAGPPITRTARGQPIDLWGGHSAGGVTATRIR